MYRAYYQAEDFWIGSDDVSAAQMVMAAVMITRQSSCFLYDQAAGGKVPDIQAGFPTSIQASRGHIG